MGLKHSFGQQRSLRIGLIFTLLSCLILQTACTQKGNDAAVQITRKSKGLSLENQIPNKLPLLSLNGVQYVHAKKLVALLGFQSEWDADNSSYRIGDKDVNFVFKINSQEAQKEGELIKLASPPIILNQSAYIPLSALGDLFQQDMSYFVSDKHLIVQDNQKDLNFSIKSANGDYLDFADDPDDPNKLGAQALSVLTNKLTVMKNLNKKVGIAGALPNIDVLLLVKKSQQYLGVNYAFGAKPYPQSGAFDCSSFTQYIFAKQGITLNRVSRDQAKQGITVSRKNLRVGDLLFFNVPGRFKSNNMIGHVGIYLGNNKMINANTQPTSGVQITGIDKEYWKRVFLSAKRVAS